MVDPVLLKKLYIEDNLSLAEISVKMGYSICTLYKRGKEAGISFNKDTKRASRFIIPQTPETQMYKDGSSIYKISEEIGISPVAVWKRLKVRGVKMDSGNILRGQHWAIEKRGRQFLGADGRIWVRGFDSSKGRNSKRRAVVVMERILGHKVPPGYHVHHEDENPLNDDPFNLEMLTASEHSKVHGRKGKY